jgi:flagellar basal-body rod protein FlgG
MDVISNNIANINTPGYKERETTFADLLYQLTNPPSFSQAPLALGSGTRLASTSRNFSQGSLQSTGRSLDIAIEGQGYLQVINGNATAYTRAGSLSLGPNGELMTASGFVLSPRINVPQGTDEIKIGQDGTVFAVQNGNLNRIGQIQLANFANPNGLETAGDNLFIETAQSGQANTAVPGIAGFGRINQGYLESSNVDLARQMTNMIIGQRAYELSSRAIKVADEMLSIANNIRR